MKRNYWIFSIFAVLLVILISGCIGPGTTQVIPCNWIYKTNGDYFNLIRANLGYDENRNEVIAMIPGGIDKIKLENGYIQEIDGCSKTLGWVKPTNVAFLSKTVQEWLQEDVACTDEMQNKLNQLRIQKCGSLDFDIFEECNTFTSTSGERICSLGIPPKDKPNPTKCTYDITQEESKNIWSCEGHKYSIDMVIDRTPFTELYFCDMVFSVGEINEFIRNNQLDTRCEKLI